jgi:hypothetical protein
VDSGQSFNEKDRQAEGSFKAAEARYTAADQVKKAALKRWLAKARDIQGDYKTSSVGRVSWNVEMTSTCLKTP